MNLRKKVAEVVVAVVMMVTAVFAFSSPAQAAKSDCSSYPGTVCMFAFNNFGNPVWRQYPSQIFGCRSLVPDGWNDVTTHAMNNTSGSYTMELWQHANCTGWVYTLTSGNNVSFYGYGHDNNASAIRIIEY